MYHTGITLEVVDNPRTASESTGKVRNTTTGHYGFNKHLHTIGKRTDPSCELCGEHMDTAEHFLCYCPAFVTARRRHLGGYTLKYESIKSKSIIDILNYIASTGRFEEMTIT